MDCGHHHGPQGCCGREHGHREGDECCHEAPEHEGAEGCCCGHGGGHECHGHGEEMRFQRRFHSRDERIAELEAYRKELQEELKGVDERIAELRPSA